jgi:SAM-dependent methyltransferase
MRFDDIPGWFDFPEVYSHYVQQVPDAGTIVEIGCWLGRSTAFLADLVREADRGIQLWAVDHGFGNADKSTDVCNPVLQVNQGNVAGRLVTNLRDCGVLDWVYPLITTSVRAARTFVDGSLDFVFLDGNHTYESVTEDLSVWWPKIKPGGFLGGHDYDSHWPDVVRAVDDFFGHPCPDPIRKTCWSVLR